MDDDVFFTERYNQLIVYVMDHLENSQTPLRDIVIGNVSLKLSVTKTNELHSIEIFIKDPTQEALDVLRQLNSTLTSEN